MNLSAEGLSKKYGRRLVVNDVSLTVEQGEIVGLLGPNGAGKTTTFYMITGMIRPDSGQVLLGDKKITKLPMYRRARLGVGYLSQEPSVFRKLTVEQNLMAILEMLPLNGRERKQKMTQLLEEFSVSHLGKQKAHTLSGGERRRVEIARALVTDPKFILLDEPFAGIDPIAVNDIQEIVRSLKSRNIGILITDHNVHETMSITDRAYLLYDGSILKSGQAQDLAEDNQVRELYLGEKFKLDR
ncbi:MAG: LPS export ABC transporter ATP-binding protein [Calditrichaeota bacterium]|nr:LPS export ABC transporter ATP-binding protein [Calditrichota bacterium]MBT7788099.1 LPS export ABC transporter ATP-binding protein [Calditrichota bacterium]